VALVKLASMLRVAQRLEKTSWPLGAGEAGVDAARGAAAGEDTVVARGAGEVGAVDAARGAGAGEDAGAACGAVEEPAGIIPVDDGKGSTTR